MKSLLSISLLVNVFITAVVCKYHVMPTSLSRKHNYIHGKPLRPFSRRVHRFRRLLEIEWEGFKTEFGKFYETLEEELLRQDIYIKNRLLIEKHNNEAKLGKHSYSLRMNHFGDLTPDEFKARANGFNMTKMNQDAMLDAVSYDELHAGRLRAPRLPKEVDWRKKGAVTEVKNQGDCGSCWAFSTTGSLEGQHFLKGGRALVSLSEQNLVDCSKKFDNDGCNGGLMTNAFRYIKANHGIDTENSYPYEGHEDKCHFKKNAIGATDNGFVALPSGDVDALKEAVATVGPISVAIDASSSKFQFYSHGVYRDNECSSTALDHGVLVVGYGVDESTPYWIIKNSWDTTWGMSGFIKMKGGRDNMCGVASQASYPLV